MNITYRAIAVVSFLFPTLFASAQIENKLEKIGGNILKKTEQHAESRATQEVDRKINKEVDKGLDKVFKPNTSTTNNNKTSTSTTTTTKPSTTTSTNTTTTKPSTTTNTTGTKSTDLFGSYDPNRSHNTTNTPTKTKGFTGNWQWEVKRYKSDKMLTDGHSVLNFYTKPNVLAVHIMNVETPTKRQSALIYNNEKHTLVTVKEAEGTASQATVNPANAATIALTRSTETKEVDGATCTKYTAEQGDLSITLWADEKQTAEMYGAAKNGIGTTRPDLTTIPVIGASKYLVREAIILDKKKGEKTHIWLNSFTPDEADDKAFDYSRYEMK